MALPRDGAEMSDFNGLKKSLGSNCLIAFQSGSERLPKPALKAMKAEPRRQYCKLTGDGTHNCRFWRYLELDILTAHLMASRRRRYDRKSLQAQNFTHPISCPVQDRACSGRQTDRT